VSARAGAICRNVTRVGSARIERMSAIPDGFAALRAAAEVEGFRNMSRLEGDWRSGVERFTGPGEALFAAFEDDALVGVGGVTREPTAPRSMLRARRFYVRPESRGRGVGVALVAAVLAHAHGHAERMLVHSSASAMVFWDRAGFARIERPGLTHERPI